MNRHTSADSVGLENKGMATKARHMPRIAPDLSEAVTVVTPTKEAMEAQGYKMIKKKGAVTAE